MRCFIAIDIDDQIRKGLSDLQDELWKEADIRKGDVKWVRPELTHLTLKFLGEIKAEQREQRKTLTDFVKVWKDTNGNGG